MAGHIVMKLLKTKDKEKQNLKSSQRKVTPFLQGKNNLNDSKFLIRHHGGRKKRHNTFQVLKEKNCQPRILHAAEIIVHSFSDEVN